MNLLIAKRAITKILTVGKNPLVRSMLLVGFISILVKLTGFYKETIIAANFGLSEVLDTYYIAILIPTIIQTIFIGSLQNLFIPNYVIELNTTQQKGSFQAFTFYLITFIAAVLTILAAIFAEFLLEIVFPGHSIGYYHAVRTQLYLVLPCLFFWGYNGFLNGLQEINNNYFLSTISQIFLPIVMIVCLVFFKDFFGDKVIVFGLLIGSFISFLFTLIATASNKLIAFGPLKRNNNMNEMLKQYPAKSISGLLTGINPFVDQFFAAQLVVGSVAALNYGIKIPAFVVGILILAIGNVLLPHFSRLISTDLDKAYYQLFKILKLVFFGGLLLTIFTILFSNDIIRILFERQEFNSEDTYIVANIQKIALIYVPFYLCTLICVKFLTAINKNKFMAWTSFWNLILNLVMNYLLVRKFGIYGLILATTIVYIIASLIYVGYTYNLFSKQKLLKG